MKITLVALVFFFAGCMSHTSSSQEIGGDWVGECTADTFACPEAGTCSFSNRQILRISENKVVLSHVSFDGDSCEIGRKVGSDIITYEISSTEKVGDSKVLSGAIVSAEKVYSTDEGVDRANNREFFQRSNWEIDVPQNILGLEEFPGDEPYIEAESGKFKASVNKGILTLSVVGTEYSSQFKRP